ncbi:hypothetical protein [Porphyrobacter sp. AAP60]|uniref:hypothetical protein n=1 Tax=Porphyrobacter sp. AAP60 TaxID=1523423 RepID=UPI0006B98D74|nr:hypothetical protein [Porphyrobacter sp. AAP60]KPF64317.1 hypothetical protein IP79_05810 [Porphyrobacter sp. AAP60]
MDMADLLQRYFGTRELEDIAPSALPAGVERMRVDFGMEQERGPRFALWTLLLVLGDAPDLDVAFEHEEDREAARNLMDMLAAAPPE